MRPFNMHADLFKAWMAIRSSYWFIPGIMALAAIVLGPVLVWLDVRVGSEWLNERFGWYQSIKASGARDVLSTIAGSMITVAGVVFSITIVAISFASGQYGPRLLTNFMSDRGNTITLGTFIATFVYCLVVLRTIRSGDDNGFVPQIAVLVGILLALCSIGVLIYFIHHVPRSMHINTVIAGVGRQLCARIAERFPAKLGEPAAELRESTNRSPKLPAESPCPVTSIRTGYIQRIEEDALLEAAAKHDLLIRLRYRPGDYVSSGRPLLDAWPRGKLSEKAQRELRAAFSVGDERTPYDDIRFLIDELVEISARALSTGINDPRTAISCIDWLGAALSDLAGRAIPHPARTDSNHEVRVIAIGDSFEDFVRGSFGQLRQYVGRDAIAARHMLRTIGIVAADSVTEEQLRALDGERKRLLEISASELHGPSLESVERLNTKLAELLALGAGNIDEREADWLGGSA